METVLMVVTLIALALAVVMSVLAWRLLRDDRQRAAARVETLRAMATSPDEPVDAWDLSLREEVQPMRASPMQVSPMQVSPMQVSPMQVSPMHASPLPASPMFLATDEPAAPARRWLAIGTVAVIMSAIVGTVYALHRPALAVAGDQLGAAVTTTAAAAPAGGSRPLELLSLRHASDPDGTFTVTGLVQNPFDGRVVRHAVAVVYLFDRDGNYFASGKASLDFTALEPGEESPFVVHVANVGRVSRYRIGFRSEEGGVIAHVDRRGQLPGGGGDALEARPAVNSAASRRSEG